MKVLRTVGEAAGAAAKENERPVVELPKVRGRAVVWRVSLGREVMVVVASGERHDMAMQMQRRRQRKSTDCLLYTSDAADEMD